MNTKAKRGFTLVELMVVVAILGILIAVAVPVYHASTNKAQTNTCLYNIKTLNSSAARRQMLHTDAASVPDDALMAQLLDENYFAQEPSCPAGGEYTCADGFFSCSVHGFVAGDEEGGGSSGSTASGIIEKSNEILAEIMKEYGDTSYASMKDYLASKGYDISKYGNGINEAFRQMMYDQNGGHWDSFEVDGKTMYVQPILNNGSGSSDRVIYYANANSTPGKGNQWDATYIYDKASGTWYKRTGGSFNLAGKVWDDVLKDMKDNPDNWKPAPEITIKPA